MRLYLDQMFRFNLAGRLRDAGHDVIRASDVGQARADDAEILARAIEENRILVTLDQHFGNWAVLPLDRHPGVIRLRLHPCTTSAATARLIPFLAARRHEDFQDCLVILSKAGVRWIRSVRG